MYLEYQATSAAKRPPQAFQQEITSGLSLDEVVKESDQHEETEMRGIMERWGTEQITDFVRKLGFLESKKDEEKKGEEQIHLFLHLNEVT